MADVGHKASLWRRLVDSAHNLDADDLRQESDECQAARCGGLKLGEMTTVQGRLRHVVYTPRESLPTVEAELFDGTGTVELVWLGRRRIAGIEPGRTIQVTGRVGEHDGRRAIYNPRYELRRPA
ncbi:MAG: Nucleic acid binding OB-fold tRNA/helicase-type [Pseudonocardiales bacterium]|nr:Nucleic acid binding OB-fold tRNA/helicase-type [Pseudonocardiales bacterium]